jgi:hypothetical protein
LALISRGYRHKPKKPRRSRFQIEDIGIIFQRVTSQARTKGKFRFQIEDIGIFFQTLSSQAQKTTEIPFSNRRYWYYFPEVPITSPKNHGNPVFK